VLSHASIGQYKILRREHYSVHDKFVDKIPLLTRTVGLSLSNRISMDNV
jgi:hypothetical protein